MTCACLGLFPTENICPEAARVAGPACLSVCAQEEGNDAEPAADTPPDEAKPAPPPAPVVLKKRPFQPELRLPGVLQPAQTWEIKLNLKEYSGELIIKEVVDSGKTVKKDDLLLAIELEGIEKTMRDAEYKVAHAKTDLDQLKKRITINEAAGRHELEKARQRARNAEEDHKNYETLDWPMDKEQSELNIRHSEAYLKDEMTELEQLEEMYKESELAGKTKEIVLERARRSVELGKQQLALSKRQQDFHFNKRHPRRLGDLERDAKWSARDLAFLEESCATEAEDIRQSLAGQELEVTKAEEAMMNLRKDKEAMTIRAPMSGVVVHGDLVARLAEGQPAGLPRHQWCSLGDRLQNETVVMTCYEEGRYSLRAAIPEAFWRLTKSGAKAKIRVSAVPGKTFDGQLAEIAYLPDGSDNTGKTFAARLELAESDEFLTPGMTCAIEFLLAEVPDAIVIPANCLIEREERTFCKIAIGEQQEEREIFIGGRTGDEVWVVSGLAEGDSVLPKE
jgi:multidrug efflux pump subunit AcrA (membrane-fusion protein)